MYVNGITNAKIAMSFLNQKKVIVVFFVPTGLSPAHLSSKRGTVVVRVRIKMNRQDNIFIICAIKKAGFQAGFFVLLQLFCFNR